MKSLCLSLAFALTLAVPAAAHSTDADFTDSLGRIGDSVNARISALMKKRFARATQQSGPNDPILLAQKPLLDMIKAVEPSVVYLSMGKGSCTGFFTDAVKELNRAAIITTNSHCVEELAIGAEIEVGLYTGDDNRPQMTKGRVLAYGASTNAKDIAFVELVDPSLNRRGLPTWSKLDRGEQVIAIGHPFGLMYSISRGIISALQRDRLSESFVLDVNQSDVTVNPGNSGGPLFNMWGSVVGINSMIRTEGGGFDGISLSLPANYITLAMRQYKRTGNLKLGAMQVELAAAEKALTVNKVVRGGAAEAARMQKDDQIVAIDGIDLGSGSAVSAMKDFLVYVKYHSPGETIAVTVRRAGQNLVLPVTLGTAKPPAPEWAPIPKKTFASSTLVPVIAET